MCQLYLSLKTLKLTVSGMTKMVISYPYCLAMDEYFVLTLWGMVSLQSFLVVLNHLRDILRKFSQHIINSLDFRFMWPAVLIKMFLIEQNKRECVGDAWDSGYSLECALCSRHQLQWKRGNNLISSQSIAGTSFLVSSFIFGSSTQQSDRDFQNENWIISLSCLQFLKLLCAACWNHPNSLVYHASTLTPQPYFSPYLNFIFYSDHSEKLFFAQMGHTLLCVYYLSGPSPST